MSVSFSVLDKQQTTRDQEGSIQVLKLIGLDPFKILILPYDHLKM